MQGAYARRLLRSPFQSPRSSATSTASRSSSISGALVYAFEKDAPGSNITSLGDALWWAAVTTTTVGYGDHSPVTTDGRAIALLLMVVGIGLVGVVTANVAAYFVEREQAEEMAVLREQLDRIEALLSSQADP